MRLIVLHDFYINESVELLGIRFVASFLFHEKLVSISGVSSTKTTTLELLGSSFGQSG